MTEQHEATFHIPEFETDKLPPLDVAIVYGGNIRKDTHGKWHTTSWVEGSEKSRGAFTRVMAAALLYREGKIKKIIVSSGHTVPSPENPLLPNPDAPAESTVMKSELIELGVPEEDIEEDATSLSTEGNAQNTAAMIRENKYQSVGLLTSLYHLPRTRMFQEAQNLEAEGCILYDLPAESIVGRDSPGYRKLMEQLYNSPRMQERLRNEQQGIMDFKSGNYKSRPPH